MWSMCECLQSTAFRFRCDLLAKISDVTNGSRNGIRMEPNCKCKQMEIINQNQPNSIGVNLQKLALQVCHKDFAENPRAGVNRMRLPLFIGLTLFLNSYIFAKSSFSCVFGISWERESERVRDPKTWIKTCKIKLFDSQSHCFVDSKLFPFQSKSSFALIYPPPITVTVYVCTDKEISNLRTINQQQIH